MSNDEKQTKKKREEDASEGVPPTKDETENQQVVELENKYKRALADYQNLEKRVREDRVGLIKMANRELLLRLLPVLDTLLLATEHSEDQSLKVSVQQFMDALKEEGVVRVETVGKEFDPTVMEAVGTEEGKDGIVIKEARSGYMMNDSLLRPAQVIVGKS